MWGKKEGAAVTCVTRNCDCGKGAGLSRTSHCMRRKPKKILGIVAATDEQKAKARKVAGTASRVNFVLSIPMLMCMAGASHGLPFIH